MPEKKKQATTDFNFLKDNETWPTQDIEEEETPQTNILA
jgi:hypothetical protein